MNNIYGLLKEIKLFKDVENIENLFSKNDFIIRDYEKNSAIKLRGDEINELIVLLEGEVKGEMSDFNGKSFQVERIKAPNLIASAFLFNKNNNIPVDAITTKKSKVLFIDKNIILKKSFENKEFMEIIIGDMSEKVGFLSEKLWLSNLKTLKEKICHYLMKQHNIQKNNIIKLPVSIEVLSQLMGVARPSLSRCFGEMEEEGILIKRGNEIEIIDCNKIIK